MHMATQTGSVEDARRIATCHFVGGGHPWASVQKAIQNNIAHKQIGIKTVDTRYRSCRRVFTLDLQFQRV